MNPIHAMIWVFIYMGMIVGVMAVAIVLAATYYDLKNKDKK
jgi:uncharacterized membrane-anchored protein YhcB (DUF1043 family)